MYEKLAVIAARYEEINELMAQPEIVSDLARLQQLAREQRELEEIARAYRLYQENERQLNDAQALLNETTDQEMRALAQEEINELLAQRTAMDEEIKLLLLPRDPNDNKNSIF